MHLIDYIKNDILLARLFYSLEFSLPSFVYGVFKKQVTSYEVKAPGQSDVILSELKDKILDDMRLQEMSPRDIQEVGNFLSIYDIAFSLIDVNVQIDKRIDTGWAAYFYERSKMISDNKEQLIWGKILVKELKTPGTIYKRTIDALSSTEESELDWFYEFLQYSLDDSYIPSFVIDNNIYPFNQFQSLIDCGFLNATLAGVSYKSKEVIKTKAGNITIDSKDGKATIGAYTLTDAGLQLCDFGEKKAPRSFYEKVKEIFEQAGNSTVDLSGLAL